MTMIVHHLEKSRSQRIVWLLEELGEAYEIKRYARDPVTASAPALLKKLHPLGKAPILQDGAMTVVESGAIFDYLLARSDHRLRKPDDAEEVLRYTHFMHYADGSIMPLIVTVVTLGRMGDAVQQGIMAVRKGLAAHLAWVDQELGTRPWFAGNSFTAADIMMSFPLEAARVRAGLDWSYANIDAWLGRIHARGAYQRALAQAEPADQPAS